MVHLCKNLRGELNIELVNNQTIAENQKYHDRFFIVKDPQKRGRKVEYNEEGIDSYKKIIQFLASILTTRLRNKLREAGWLKNVTLQEVIDEMKSLREVSQTGKRKRLMTTLTSKQQEILKLCRISA